MKTVKNKILLVAAMSLSMVSCNNYLDVNDEPNKILQEKITPALLLPGAMTNAHRVQSRDMNRLGNIFMQNWGGDVNNFTGANVDEYSLQISNSFYSNIWDGTFAAVNNFQQILNYPGQTTDNHKAVAYIMKSYYMQYMVDLYGDVPYSDAFKGQEVPTPAYDDDQVVYRDLITSIDKGIALFYAADSSDEALGTSDVMFAGNVSKWLKFATTLKVKILLRQAELATTDAATQTYLNDQFAAITASGIAFLDTDATINPGYNTTSNTSLNPFYNLFKDSAGNNLQFNNFCRATDYISDFMNGDLVETAGIIDARRAALYTLEGGKVVGAVQGDVTGPEPMSSIGSGLIVAGTQNGYVMTLSEINFLISEARERGYLVGDAEQAFNDGVTASFAKYGLAGSAPGYIFAVSSLPGIGWNGNHIEAIMTQKWLAVNGVNAIESYIDMTRTGFPVIPLATTAQQANRPYRLLYPTSELVANSGNVPNVSLSQIFVQGPFWKI